MLCAAKIEYDSGRRRNPFIPLNVDDVVSASNTAGGIRLEGIIYDPRKESLAILNGKTYKTGDALGEVVVRKIQKTSVVLLENGEEQILRIREEEKNQST